MHVLSLQGLKIHDIYALHFVMTCCNLMLLVHKQMSIITLEGSSTIFEASMKVYFTYFCQL